jgi:glycosyltransferase involved in cell wall biosynthesis
VLIEAFRHRTPVVARRIGPFPEIVEQSKGGLLFSNPSELTAALGHLQRDRPFRDSLAASGFAACRERWTEDVVIDQLLALVADAQAQRTSGRATSSPTLLPS